MLTECLVPSTAEGGAGGCQVDPNPKKTKKNSDTYSLAMHHPMNILCDVIITKEHVSAILPPWSHFLRSWWLLLAASVAGVYYTL